MLKKQKDYWKNKATKEYLAKVNEIDTLKQEEENQKGWNKRYKESKWLLKGTKKTPHAEQLQAVSDAGLQHRIEHTEKSRTALGRYSILFTSIRDRFGGKTSSHGNAAAIAEQQAARDGDGNRENSLESMLPSRLKEKKIARIRNEKFVFKEGIARKWMARDKISERDKFLEHNALKIRLLQNIHKLLRKERMPAHHSLAAVKIPDFPPEMSKKEALAVSEANLRNYTLEVTQRVVEPLRSVAEVELEDAERKRFRPPGSVHAHRGADKVYALKHVPATHTVLHSQHAVREMYPENHLLPDEAERARLRVERRKVKEKETAPIRRIKKSKLDLSRRQFRFADEACYKPTPTDPGSVRAEPSFGTFLTFDGSLGIAHEYSQLHSPVGTSGRIRGTAGRGDDDGWVGGRVTATDRTLGRSIDDESFASDNEGGNADVRYSQQFKWKERRFVDDNSVFYSRHGPVSFDPKENTSNSPAEDDSTTASSVKFYLTEEGSVSEAARAGSRKSRSAGLLQRNALFQESLSTNTQIAQELAQNSQYDHSYDCAQNQEDWESTFAVRSNYFSEGSTRNQSVVRIPMARHRITSRHKHVKGLRLESKHSQCRRVFFKRKMRKVKPEEDID